MKIIELIKSFKFLNFKKYISTNLFVIVFYLFCILSLIDAVGDFPPPVEVSGWGEPHFEYSSEEYRVLALISISVIIMAFSPFLFLYEFFLRLIIEFIVKKFFPKMLDRKTHTSKFKLPKIISVIYSIIFYMSFVGFIFILFIFNK